MSKRVNNKKGRGKGGRGRWNAQWLNETSRSIWNMKQRGEYARASRLETKLETVKCHR